MNSLIVILSEAETSRSEVPAQSKDPYSTPQRQHASIVRKPR